MLRKIRDYWRECPENASKKLAVPMLYLTGTVLYESAKVTDHQRSLLG